MSSFTPSPHAQGRRASALATRTQARRRTIASVAAISVAGAGLALVGGAAAAPHPMPEHRTITFPVQEAVTYSDTWGACRGTNCSRRHMGQDLIGKRLMHLRAATDGTITKLQIDTGGTAGNYLVMTDAQGWSYWYMHINNDTPGTDDGTNPAAYRWAPGIVVGSKVKAGQFIAYMGDSGNAEYSVPHLHFEQHRPDNTAINAWASLRLSQGLAVDSVWCGPDNNPDPTDNPASANGLWVVDSLGKVQTAGSAPRLGDASALKLWGAMLGIRRTQSSKGYYLIARDGGVFTYGDAKFYGSTGGWKLDAPIAGITPTPSGKGYWLFADDGGIFSFGDAKFQGSGWSKLGGAVAVGMTPTPTGKGYWIAASDGRVLNFGDAPAAPAVLSKPVSGRVKGIVATTTGKGYWLLTDAGTVAPAGDAAMFGMPARSGLCQSNNSSSIMKTATGNGYWVVLKDGTILNFGDALSFGSVTMSSAAVGIEAAQ